MTNTTIEIDQEAVAQEAAKQIAKKFLWTDYEDGDEDGDGREPSSRTGDKLIKRVVEIIEKRVAKQIEHHLSTVPDRIEQVVEKLIEEGYPTTNSYGEVTGKAISLEDRVREKLFKGDRYNHSSWVEQTTTKFIEQQIKGELKPLFDEAKKKMKGLMDASLMEKLAKSMREGLGLRG